MGYDKVIWGTSIQDVRKAYGISDSVETIPVIGSTYMVNLVQEYESDSIERRVFRFLNNKLCTVIVSYKIPSVSIEDLLTALKGKFGESTDYEDYKGNTITMEYIIFGKYSPELVVNLTRVYWTYNMEETERNVWYIDQKSIDEYEASKVEL
jgi:hypothetical protein